MDWSTSQTSTSGFSGSSQPAIQQHTAHQREHAELEAAASQMEGNEEQTRAEETNNSSFESALTEEEEQDRLRDQQENYAIMREAEAALGSNTGTGQS
jgi:hypothetical protein